MKNYVILGSTLITLGGCGGSSNEDNFNLTGTFIDSAVSGLQYSTETRSGFTDGFGMLAYSPGESVTLSIGQLAFPSFPAQETMSPLDVFDATEVSDVRVVNLAMLLQSLDADSNPENGIEILEDVASNAPSTIDFLQDSTSFAQDAGVINMVSNSGAVVAELISPIEASRHLQSTLLDAGELEGFDPVEYTNIVVGNTTTYTNEGNSYYYRTDGVRFAIENGVEAQTTWELDDSGAICEGTVSGETFCVADAPGYMMTRTQGSEIYNYSDENYVGVFTVASGDSLTLSN